MGMTSTISSLQEARKLKGSYALILITPGKMTSEPTLGIYL